MELETGHGSGVWVAEGVQDADSKRQALVVAFGVLKKQEAATSSASAAEITILCCCGRQLVWGAERAATVSTWAQWCWQDHQHQLPDR